MIYAIWKDVNDRNVKDVKDLVGVFSGTHEEATELIRKMNADDIEVSDHLSLAGGVRFGYWYQEANTLDLTNYRGFICAE